MLVLAAVAGAPACGCEAVTSAPPTPAEQCAGLTSTIASEEAAVTELADAGIRVLRKTAARREEAGARVGRLVLTEPALGELQRRYADNARDLAEAERDIAAAIEADDKGERFKAEERHRSSMAASRHVAAELARACGSPPAR